LKNESMVHLNKRMTAGPLAVEAGASVACLTLSFEDRRKSRLRAYLDDGREVGVFLARGTILHEGDCLVDDDETVLVVVKANMETLSVARTTDLRLLARAAYHLGNRHVPLQVGADWLAYGHDHVLDDMVRALGLSVAVEQRPFEPEAGGYGPGHAENQATAHAHEPGVHHDH
jgi:urease accessory protein